MTEGTHQRTSHAWYLLYCLMVRSYLSHALNIYLLSYLMTVGSHLLPDTSYLRPAYFYPTPDTSNISRLPLSSRLTALVPDTLFLRPASLISWLSLISRQKSSFRLNPISHLTLTSKISSIFSAFHEAVANAAALSVNSLQHLQRVGLYQNKWDP